MPHYWNNILVVTKDELVPAWYTVAALDKQLSRHKDLQYGIKRVRSGGGGHELLIKFDSLLPEIQDAIGDPRKHNHLLEKFYKVDNKAVVFYSSYMFDDGSYLKSDVQERYIINASVLTAVIHLRESRIKIRQGMGGSLYTKKPRYNETGGVDSVVSTICKDAASFNPTLFVKHKVNHTLPTNQRQFAKVLKDFETFGYSSLISGRHKNQNSLKVTEDTLNLLNNMFGRDKTKPTATEVYRRYNEFITGDIEIINNATGECYQPAAFRKISDATVKRYMAKWENKIGNYALRSGDRQKLMQQFKPYHSMKRAKYAGDILSIDDRQPPFKALNGKRVWFYNGIDLASDAFTCWVYGSSKDGIIIEFYRQLVRNYAQWGFNLPAELEAEMSLNSSYVDTFLKPGAMFQYVRIEANNARGKRIERANHSLRYDYEKGEKGFIARPFAKSESNQPGPGEVVMIPFNDIITTGLRAIESYNNAPHPVEKDMSRWDYFCQHQNPNLQPTNYKAFLPYIGHKTATSCRVGIIRFKEREFLLGYDGKVALGERLINLMKRVEGEEIDIWWLDGNDGQVLKALVYINDNYICEAVAKPVYQRAKIGQTANDNEARTIMSAYVATIDGFGRKQKNSTEAVTLISNKPQPKKTFVMPGLKQYDFDNGHVAEVLPQITDEYLEKMYTPKGGWVKSLKDSF